MVSLLAMTVVMFVALVGAFLYVSGWNWREYNYREPSLDEVPGRIANSPVSWILAFILLVAWLGAAAVVYVSGSAAQQATMLIVLASGFVVMFGGFLLIGTYRMARNRGLSIPVAATVSAWAVGLFVVLGISVKLVVGL